MKKSKFPPGWNEDRVRKVLEHCGQQSEKKAVAPDEAAYENASYTVMEIPKELVPKGREFIAKRAG